MDNVLHFINEIIPSREVWIWVLPLSILYSVSAAWAVGHIKTTRNIKTAYTRKVYHLLIFTAAYLLQLYFGLSAVIILGSVVSICVLFAVWKGSGFPFYEAMARPKDRPKRSLFIIIPLITTALGGMLSNIFFLEFAIVGYLVGGIGDAVGEPAGAYFGKHWYKVHSIAGVSATRSLEGSTAVFLGSLFAASIALHSLEVAETNVLIGAAACALGAALVEALSTHGLDNLTIQVAASGIAYWFLG